MGATLYKMLTGEPPFLGHDTLATINMHLQQIPAPVNQRRPELSDAITILVAKALEKVPSDRFIDARAMLDAMEKILHGEASRIESHPRIPADTNSDILTYAFTFNLDTSPESLWPYVSDTNRINRAIGLSNVDYAFEEMEGDHQPLARMNGAGLELEWKEFPLEWIEGRRLGVFREFQKGPFHWLRSIVELQKLPTGGTSLLHTIQILPSGFVGRAAAAGEIGFRTRRNLGKVYQRIDTFLKSREPAQNSALEL